MKLIRFRVQETIFSGRLDNQYAVTSDGHKFPIDSIEFLAPCTPSKIVGVAINYAGITGGAKDIDEPLVFFKSPSSLIGPGSEIRSAFKEPVWGEPELAIVIGERCTNITEEEVQSHILGYTIANDVTADNVFGWDHHLARSKSQDTFCILDHYIDTEFVPNDQKIQGYHNEKLLRDGKLSDRLWTEIPLISWLSQWMTLEAGDIVLTGTPSRIRDRHYFREGDTFDCVIEGLGEFRNTFSS